MAWAREYGVGQGVWPAPRTEGRQLRQLRQAAGGGCLCAPSWARHDCVSAAWAFSRSAHATRCRALSSSSSCRRAAAAAWATSAAALSSACAACWLSALAIFCSYAVLFDAIACCVCARAVATASCVCSRACASACLWAVCACHRTPTGRATAARGVS
jgi:hypothetical protein